MITVWNRESPKAHRYPVDRALNSAEIDAAIGKQLADRGSIYSLDTGLLEEFKPDLVILRVSVMSAPSPRASSSRL